MFTSVGDFQTRRAEVLANEDRARALQNTVIQTISGKKFSVWTLIQQCIDAEKHPEDPHTTHLGNQAYATLAAWWFQPCLHAGQQHSLQEVAKLFYEQRDANPEGLASTRRGTDNQGPDAANGRRNSSLRRKRFRPRSPNPGKISPHAHKASFGSPSETPWQSDSLRSVVNTLSVDVAHHRGWMESVQRIYEEHLLASVPNKERLVATNVVLSAHQHLIDDKHYRSGGTAHSLPEVLDWVNKVARFHESLESPDEEPSSRPPTEPQLQTVHEFLELSKASLPVSRELASRLDPLLDQVCELRSAPLAEETARSDQPQPNPPPITTNGIRYQFG